MAREISKHRHARVSFKDNLKLLFANTFGKAFSECIWKDKKKF